MIDSTIKQKQLMAVRETEYRSNHKDRMAQITLFNMHNRSTTKIQIHVSPRLKTIIAGRGVAGVKSHLLLLLRAPCLCILQQTLICIPARDILLCRLRAGRVCWLAEVRGVLSTRRA